MTLASVAQGVVKVDAQGHVRVFNQRVLELGPTANEVITVHVTASPEVAPKGSHPIYFAVKSVDGSGVDVEEKSSFIGE